MKINLEKGILPLLDVSLLLLGLFLVLLATVNASSSTRELDTSTSILAGSGVVVLQIGEDGYIYIIDKDTGKRVPTKKSLPKNIRTEILNGFLLEKKGSTRTFFIIEYENSLGMNSWSQENQRDLLRSLEGFQYSFIYGR